MPPTAEDRGRTPDLEHEPVHARAGRYGRRAALYLWLFVLAVAGVLFIILIAENTRRVKIGWVFGYSHISLVFLVVFATLIGWLLGIATGFLVRRRTRRPLTARQASRP